MSIVSSLYYQREVSRMKRPVALPWGSRKFYYPRSKLLQDSHPSKLSSSPNHKLMNTSYPLPMQSRSFLLSQSLSPLQYQKRLLLLSTLLQIHKEHQPHKTHQTQRKQKVKRHGIVARGTRIDDRRRNNRPNERRRLANYAEQREKQKLLTARRDFGDHDLTVRVPGADEEPVIGLVEPHFPDAVESKALRPDTDHAPTVEEDDGYSDGVEHGFGAEAEALLDVPEAVDADSLAILAFVFFLL